jgi:hypothetical protein
MQPMRVEMKDGHYDIRPYLPGDLDNYELERIDSFVRKSHISKINDGFTTVVLGLTLRYCMTAFSGIGLAASPGLVALVTIASVGSGAALIIWGISCLPTSKTK